MSNIQSHSPNDLVLRFPREGTVFQPGHVVSHVDDPISEGMVMSRRDLDDEVVCDVLWSVCPGTRPVDMTSPPVRDPVPLSATWHRTVMSEGLRGQLTVTYDGDEVYDSTCLTGNELRVLQSGDHRNVRSSWHVDEDGMNLHVRRQGIPEQWVPDYVRNMRGEVGRFRNGRQTG